MTRPGIRILIVDDEEKMRRILEIMLQRMGHVVTASEDGADALQRLREDTFDLVISDLRMPGLDGDQLLAQLRKIGNKTPFIIVTAHGSVQSAVSTMRQGAHDYILRPFDIDTIKLSIDRVLTSQEVLRQNAFLMEERDKGMAAPLGSSQAMLRVHEQVALVAPQKTAVLITGETGTGKEVIAYAIHQKSPRRDRLFVPVNCAAIPPDMIESELFGYEKGAFTGAYKDRVGKFELSSGGTIFLDEITEMPIALQAKLLRVLQDNIIERLGSNVRQPLDIRVIAATNRDPGRAVAEGKLREDLYYRINVFSIALPALRTYREDIPVFVDHFIRELSDAGHVDRGITDAALARLADYDWPGNVRELRNVIERALVLSRGDRLDVQHFPIEPATSATTAAVAGAAISLDDTEDLNLARAVDAVEERMIAEALRRSGGNKTKAAAILGISGRSLWYKLDKFNADD